MEALAVILSVGAALMVAGFVSLTRALDRIADSLEGVRDTMEDPHRVDLLESLAHSFDEMT